MNDVVVVLDNFRLPARIEGPGLNLFSEASPLLQCEIDGREAGSVLQRCVGTVIYEQSDR